MTRRFDSGIVSINGQITIHVHLLTIRLANWAILYEIPFLFEHSAALNQVVADHLCVPARGMDLVWVVL